MERLRAGAGLGIVREVGHVRRGDRVVRVRSQGRSHGEEHALAVGQQGRAGDVNQGSDGVVERCLGGYPVEQLAERDHDGREVGAAIGRDARRRNDV